MEYVFILMHARETSNGSEKVKNIGVYSTQDKAEMALKRASTLPEFLDYVEGFYIGCYKLNRSGWVEGYFTDIPGEEE